MNSLVWLRRDLRLHDHAVLAAALASAGQVQPVFIFDTDILRQFNQTNDRRLTFIAEALCALDAELQQRGGRLLVLHGKAVELIPALAKELDARVFAAEDFEPQTIRRDEAVAKKAPLTLVKDHLIFAPGVVLKNDGTPFKVFTPYSNSWLARLSSSDYSEYAIHDKGRYANLAALDGVMPLSMEKGAKGLLAQIGYMSADISLWPVDDGGKRLHHFIRDTVGGYKDSRDMLAENGTSQLSPYLRFGLVSIREAVRQAVEHGDADKWLLELIWREFYAMILYHYPESVTMEWNEKYRDLKWRHDEKQFAAWQEGRTGYPVVDAAMRQLLEIGWMHNRARMIVASFLTKHLQIDWRWGEAHFAQYLMDYELASNVGGWQWSASTGTDAQPYFRVFNPTLQSKKFDPDGEYIRRYVPELRGIKSSAIHQPSPLERGEYPAPIVVHEVARKQALAMFAKGN